MSGVSLPVNRPVGRALVVGSASNRSQPIAVLQSRYGYECAGVDDPYAAMLELCRRRAGYNALILSLASLYREELGVIATVKRRLPHVEIWLAHTDGRQATLAEGVRLGADGLLAEDGLHRMTAPILAPQRPSPESIATGAPPAEPLEPSDSIGVESPPGEPVLTSEELRALLQDQPSMPPSGAPEKSQ